VYTETGILTNVSPEQVGYFDETAPDGLRVEDILKITLQSSSDDERCSLTVRLDDSTPFTLEQLETWMTNGELVTAFISRVRAIAYPYDRSVGSDGKPVKQYQRAGRQVPINGEVAELGAFVTFDCYDLRPAGQVHLGEEANKARGARLKRAAEFRKTRQGEQQAKAAARLEEKRVEAKKRLAEKQATKPKAK
jgi:hypothetical protein